MVDMLVVLGVWLTAGCAVAVVWHRAATHYRRRRPDERGRGYGSGHFYDDVD